jgi:hypothetical protein
VEPEVGDLHEDISEAPFSGIAGIPSIDLKFINSELNWTEFPAQFDTYKLVRSVLDPNLQNLQTCAKMIVANLRHLVSTL